MVYPTAQKTTPPVAGVDESAVAKALVDKVRMG
ncbi:MAG: hypothetical protein UW94_C0001G0022 [Parcubacteria group bacterium GW2011_GWA2_45_14]|nr:MAG: hypothetical protein UW94_C0001G0022 [Parcubacteria group bacterium GW2011_GWA2_45_14]